MREIKLDVVIPERYVWEFMELFGKEFAVNCLEGGKKLRAVDGYFEHPGGWHVQVSFRDKDESRFYSFLRTFCESRKIPFRDSPYA